MSGTLGTHGDITRPTLDQRIEELITFTTQCTTPIVQSAPGHVGSVQNRWLFGRFLSRQDVCGRVIDNHRRHVGLHGRRRACRRRRSRFQSGEGPHKPDDPDGEQNHRGRGNGNQESSGTPPGAGPQGPE